MFHLPPHYRAAVRRILPSWLIALAIWVLAVTPSLIAKRINPRISDPYWIEALVFLLGLLFLASFHDTRMLLEKIGRLRSFILLSVLSLLIYGQLENNCSRTYPFCAWSMYTSPRPLTTFARYDVVYKDGATGEFPFQSVLAYTPGRPFEARFRPYVVFYREGKTAKHLKKELNQLVKTYNRRHPENPIMHLTAFRVTVPIENFEGKDSLIIEPVMEISTHG